MMTGLIGTCSVWKNNTKYRLCQAEYVALFIPVYIHHEIDRLKLINRQDFPNLWTTNTSFTAQISC
jgi:hypothetical protein